MELLLKSFTSITPCALQVSGVSEAGEVLHAELHDCLSPTSKPFSVGKQQEKKSYYPVR